MKRLALPLGLTVALIGSQLLAAPRLSDPVSGVAPASLHLSTPIAYLILAPLFTLWDGASMLSMSRLRGLLLGLVLLHALWRILHAAGAPRSLSWLGEIRVLILSILGLAAFLIVGAVWHRPMLALAGLASDELVVDFHSHTNASHDVRNTWMRGFDVEANRRWHRRAGFDAAFITDHNIAGHHSGVRGKETGAASEATMVCPGIEVSAWQSHIVLLGDSLPVDRGRFNRSLEGLLTLLRISDLAYGALSIASLPEYRKNHWERLDTLVAAGLDGLEIVNASPKANEISRADRDSVIRLARARDRVVLGVSDSHGWGATSMVWNLVTTAGIQPGDDRCQAVLRRLHHGFGAVQVIERHRLRPDDWWPLWLTPIGLVWETWRSMGWALTMAWATWIWAIVLGGMVVRSRLSPRRAPRP